MTKLDDLIDELRSEKLALQGYNEDLFNAVKGWAENVGLSKDDFDLAERYITDLIGDTVGTKISRLNREIDELEGEKYDSNQAKLGKEDLL
tara:strand:- start:2419 stop:2691 length:273 start_codon:yes stop_codon:yes gene_type:complete